MKAKKTKRRTDFIENHMNSVFFALKLGFFYTKYVKILILRVINQIQPLYCSNYLQNPILFDKYKNKKYKKVFGSFK